MKKQKLINYLSAALLAFFGLITLVLSTAIIFDLFGVRAMEGHYVLFVVIANFVCSLLYLFAAYGFISHKPWTINVLWLSVGILALALIGLFIHINSGGLYETKTIGALIFRMVVTVLFVGAFYGAKRVGQRE